MQVLHVHSKAIYAHLCSYVHTLISLLCASQSNMKSLEQELHCSVCKDIVKQPVVLPCQHSVCLMCASEVLVANGYPPPDLPPEPNSPASTPNTRSPRQVRRPTPKSEQRPIDRVLRSGRKYFLIRHFNQISWGGRLCLVWIKVEALWIDMQMILFTPKPTLDVTLSQWSNISM